MRKVSVFLFAVLSIASYSQDQKETRGMTIEIGRTVHSNAKNEIRYYTFKIPDYSIQNINIKGMQVKFIIPGKYDHINYVFGAIYETTGHIGSDWWQPGNTNSSDFILNGGGVFAGLNPKIGTEHLGLNFNFNIGVYSYKEYQGIFNNVTPPYVDVLDKRASHGLGSSLEVGIYAKIWRISLCPGLHLLFTGGDQASFLFKGFIIPIAFDLDY